MEEENLNTKTIILLTIVLFIVSCSRTYPIQKDFDNKMKIIQSGDMSNFGKAEGNVNTILKNFSKVYGEGMKKITYNVNKVESKGNIATINVTLKSPNLSSYIGEFQTRLSEKMSKSMPKNNEDLQKEVMQVEKEFFNEKFNSKDLKFSEKTLDVKYLKNGKDWIISNENEEFFKMITFGLAN